jgi:hypothetical protein
MSEKNRLKITVLKRQDPKEIFDVYPVAEREWFVPPAASMRTARSSSWGRT